MDMSALSEILDYDEWIRTMLPVVWSSFVGAFLRVLLLLKEPFLLRVQNALAGLVLAVTLASTTAQILTDGEYIVIYGVMYGVVGRELVMSMFDFAPSAARPFIVSIFGSALPFLKPFLLKYVANIKDKSDDVDSTH